ncbi:MAG: hypothetical protein KKG40_06600 [Gammaproteobacteria bacterium]|nr:hypothetical protein [Gammaproteobacteria bacterium]
MRLPILTLLAVWSAATLAGTDSSIDAETGLTTWQTESQGIQVRLTQISPDQTRSFYQARGFSPAAAERYASECVFMTVVRNIGDTPIQHRLADWRYESAGAPPRAIRSKTEWERIWKQLGAAESARIAFTWAQFPDTQTFAPDDWNQGMTSYSVPRGDQFDLRFVWRTGGTIHSGILEQVKCAHEHS